MINEEQKDQAVHDKRKHVRITILCNNNCIFCLAGDEKKTPHYPIEDLEKELKEGILEGCTRLILSGGEASIHPNFIDLIKKGKELGYKKIQTISNGRMYSYRKFLLECKNAGLDEITFSVHGHTPELQDSLTNIKGSFAQTIAGIKNALSINIIVSSDIVLNKKNYKYFPKIIEFLYNLGVREIDVLHLTPFGSAYNNLNELAYTNQEIIPYLHKGLKFALEHEIVIWTNRIPAECLEGFEELIQDSAKYVDEMMGRKYVFERTFKNKTVLPCYGGRCKLCNVYTVCKEILWEKEAIDYRKEIKDEFDKIILTKDNLLDINNLIVKSDKEINFILPCPGESNLIYKNNSFKIPAETNKIIQLLKINKKQGFFENIPACMCKSLVYKSRHNILQITDGIPQIIPFTVEYSKRNKVKGAKCDSCYMKNSCEGIYQKYIQKYGFNELNPLSEKEERKAWINLGGKENNSIFAPHAKENSEEFVNFNKIKKEIRDYSRKGHHSIIFSGNDTTSHPNIIKAISFASKRGFLNINLITDGRQLKDKILLWNIIDSGATCIMMDMNSHLEEIEDKLSDSKGSFKEKVEALENLAELQKDDRLPNGVVINLIYNNLNRNSINETISFFASFGIQKIRISIMKPDNITINQSELLPSKSDYEKDMPELIKNANKKGISIVIIDN